MRRALWIICIGVGVMSGISPAVVGAGVPVSTPPSEDELTPQEAARFDALLNQIAVQDQQILTQLDAMMTELQIVKTRASIRRPRQEQDN